MTQRRAIQVEGRGVVLLEWPTCGGLWLAEWRLEATDNLPGFSAFCWVVALPFNREDANWRREELTSGPNRFGHRRDDELHCYPPATIGTQLPSDVRTDPGDQPGRNALHRPDGMDLERGLRPVERHQINEAYCGIGCKMFQSRFRRFTEYWGGRVGSHVATRPNFLRR